MEAKVRIIKRANVATRSTAEESERQRRIEISMLQVFVQRYPEQARRFVRDLPLKETVDRNIK